MRIQCCYGKYAKNVAQLHLLLVKVVKDEALKGRLHNYLKR